MEFYFEILIKTTKNTYKNLSTTTYLQSMNYQETTFANHNHVRL